MIASDLLHARQAERKEELATLFYTAAATLFPTLSFSQNETAKNKLAAEEVVWIEGTITVSF